VTTDPCVSHALQGNPGIFRDLSEETAMPCKSVACGQQLVEAARWRSQRGSRAILKGYLFVVPSTVHSRAGTRAHECGWGRLVSGTVAFTLRAAMESLRRGWRGVGGGCQPDKHVTGQLRPVWREVRAGPAGCGRTLCHRAGSLTA